MRTGDPDRIEIITFDGSFHGRSTGAIAAAGSEKMVKGFGPLMPGFTHLKWGDHDALRAAVTDRTAAVMVEPIQGEGGIRAMPDACLKGLRELCDQTGALLILDEVQCGMGRTGRLFAHEWAGVTPDIMMVAKGIGGGFPLGAVLATENAAAGMVAGTHGSTYGGNPLGCAVAARVMEIIADDAFLAEVNRKGGLFRQRLEGLVAAHPEVFEAVRGQGLMLGLKCRIAPADVVKAGYGAQVLTVPAADNVVRLLPPLTITDAEIAEAVARLDARRRGADREGRVMQHFLDIHITDPADLRGMIDSARAMKTARNGRPKGMADDDQPLGGADGRADLRKALDPHAGQLRRRRAADGRADDGAVGQGDAARPRRDHRRHRAGAVALRRPDHDPHVRRGDAAGDGGTRDGAGHQRPDQPHPSLPDHGRRDDLRGTSRPDRGPQGGLVGRRQQRLRVLPACGGAVRVRFHLHRAGNAGPRTPVAGLRARAGGCGPRSRATRSRR